MSQDAKVQIGLSSDFLEGVGVTTPAGANLFREGVVVSDPEVAEARARITNTAPAADAYGLVVRIAGGSGGGASSEVSVINEVEVKNDAGNPLSVSGTVSVGNFPATQTVTGTVQANNLVGGTAVSNANPLPISDAGGSLTVDGTVAATQSGAWSVAVNNFPATQAVSGTVSVGNFPATQAVSGTVTVSQATAANLNATVTGSVSVSNFPATQAVSGTVTANLGTLNGAATAANQTTTNTTLASLDNKTPDESGAWGYNAGVSGTLTVAANKRILAITATAPTLAAASMTINGGQTITIPAGTSITITPRANLTAPTLVFTGTSAYFVEFIE